MIQSVVDLQTSSAGALKKHYSSTFYELLDGPFVTKTSKYLRVKTGEATPFANMAYLFDPESKEDALEAVAELNSLPCPAMILLSEEPTDVVKDALRDQGFTNQGESPVMIVEIDQLKNTTCPEGFRFERVTSRDLSDGWVKAAMAGFELPAIITNIFSAVDRTEDFSAEAKSQWFAMVHGDQVVGVSLLNCVHGIAGMYCVATLKEFRGKGIGAHVTAEPLRIAAKLGYKVGTLQASPDGYPVYKRIGFQDFGTMPRYLRTTKQPVV